MGNKRVDLNCRKEMQNKKGNFLTHTRFKTKSNGGKSKRTHAKNTKIFEMNKTKAGVSMNWTVPLGFQADIKGKMYREQSLIL